MNTLEQKYADRKEKTIELARRFNNIAIKENSIVRLTVDDGATGGSFQIVYQIEDRFIETEFYDKGSAIIYPSDAVRNLILELAGELGKEVSWNNTATIGRFNF